MTRHLDVVFLDVGGVMYDDSVYASALFRALVELGAGISWDEFAREYDRCRREQGGSFRRRLAKRFLGPAADAGELAAQASRYWDYPPEALLPDVAPCLERLVAAYRLGVIANQQSWIREVMRRDGIEGYFAIWGVSEELGLEKPDPRIFAHALVHAEVEPARTAMVGDRLDYDVVPARGAGMHTVWVLRGEAPDDPTPEQLAVPDASIRSLAELPAALDRL